MPGTEKMSTPAKSGPVFNMPVKVDVSSIIMSDKSLDLSILEKSPLIVTDEHLALIDELLKKAKEKKAEWEVCMHV